jgi:hypothetical protein
MKRQPPAVPWLEDEDEDEDEDEASACRRIAPASARSTPKSI